MNRMTLFHQNSGNIGKYTPFAIEISLDRRVRIHCNNFPNLKCILKWAESVSRKGSLKNTLKSLLTSFYWLVLSLPGLWHHCCLLRVSSAIKANIGFGAQSFVHFSAQTQLCSKKIFMWFQWFIGSKLWPNNTVNTKFCVEMFHISQPPQNALYHTVQMVLVDPCDRLISRFW